MGLNSNSKPCPHSGPGLLTPSEKVTGQKDKPSTPNEDCPHGFLPNMGSILNSNPCPQSETCPLTQSEKAINQNDKPTPPCQPLEEPNSRDSMVCEPKNSGSSAGHTPFPNRLASLARDLRRRQLGTPCLSKTLLGPKSVGEIGDGAKKPDHVGSISSSPKKGLSRNEHVLGMGLTDSGNDNQVMGRMINVEKMKNGNAKTYYMQIQGDCDLRKGETSHQSSPDSVEKVNGMGDAEDFDPNQINKGGSRGGKGKNVDTGLDRADFL